MILIPWVIDNSSWLIPVAGWACSEVAGLTSGAKKASVVQIVVDLLEAIPKFIMSISKK